MKSHEEKCIKTDCELERKSVAPLDKVATHCIDDHQLSRDDFDTVGELAEVLAKS